MQVRDFSDDIDGLIDAAIEAGIRTDETCLGEFNGWDVVVRPDYGSGFTSILRSLCLTHPELEFYGSLEFLDYLTQNGLEHVYVGGSGVLHKLRKPPNRISVSSTYLVIGGFNNRGMPPEFREELSQSLDTFARLSNGYRQTDGQYDST